MSERLTHSDVFGGILTNSEINHFGGAHTGTEVAYCGEPIDKLFEIENMCYDASGNEIISLSRLRELAEAEWEGRVVVLPVAVNGIAETSAGKAIVKNWDIVARVTFCEPLNGGRHWGDKYADFDISDIADASKTDAVSWHETETDSKRALSGAGDGAKQMGKAKDHTKMVWNCPFTSTFAEFCHAPSVIDHDTRCPKRDAYFENCDVYQREKALAAADAGKGE